jgi:cytochrome c oxidase subunit 3
MTDEIYIPDQSTNTPAIHPKRFILWLFIVSIVMLFAALTSAYIVRQSDGNWLEYELPAIFWVTSGIIVLSSLSMHYAYISARKDNLTSVKIGLSSSLVLGFAFLIGQFLSWGYLVDHDVYFVGNPAGSFLYVLTGLHGLHLVSGLIFVLIVLIGSFRYRVHSKNMLNIELSMTYWHFLGVLWIYLFFFLKLNH